MDQGGPGTEELAAEVADQKARLPGSRRALSCGSPVLPAVPTMLQPTMLHSLKHPKCQVWGDRPPHLLFNHSPAIGTSQHRAGGIPGHAGHMQPLALGWRVAQRVQTGHLQRQAIPALSPKPPTRQTCGWKLKPHPGQGREPNKPTNPGEPIIL